MESGRKAEETDWEKVSGSTELMLQKDMECFWSDGESGNESG